MSNRLMIGGTAAAIAGLLLLFGQSLSTGGAPTALALVSPVATSPVPTLPATSTPPEQRSTPQPSETPSRLKTRTPTATSTEKPNTATPVPPTVAPTNTPRPIAGNEGISVKPPNTGSGGGSDSAGTNWLLGMGALLVLLGGGTALVGVKQRR